MKSLCPTCIRETNQRLLFDKEVRFDEEDGGWWEEHSFQVIQCEGCDTISFRILYTDVAQHDGDSPNYSQELFPRRTINTIQIKNLLNTPPNIKKIYRETIDSFNNDLMILCSAGLRAIIEGICNEKGIEGGEVIDKEGKKKQSKNLDGKIEGLVSKGFLTKANSEVLHDLRFLGNEAIHELSSPSSAELKMAIGIVEHTIENVYELHAKAKKLKEERAKRKDEI